ncbi:MAG: hypothetical protein Q7T33_14530 [Dehalococcoidia bacterium]|nr:hypothetical protein [Dehalococcoidia bacterium]
MNAALALTVGMARSWVALYTVRLPLEIREGRRCEIDSDLWEQQWLAAHRGDPALGTAIEVLARMLFGVISDITWRAQAGSPARPDRSLGMNEALYMRGLVGMGVVLALFLIITGIGSIAASFLGSGDGSALGIGLVAAGAIAAAVAWYWMLVITIPIGIAMVAIAFFRARQSGWPRGTNAA